MNSLLDSFNSRGLEFIWICCAALICKYTWTFVPCEWIVRREAAAPWWCWLMT